MQDITPLVMMKDDVYVDGDFWDYWRATFLPPSVTDMWDFVLDDIDNERSEFVRSVAWRGPGSVP